MPFTVTYPAAATATGETEDTERMDCSEKMVKNKGAMLVANTSTRWSESSMVVLRQEQKTEKEGQCEIGGMDPEEWATSNSRRAAPSKNVGGGRGSV